MPKDLLFQSPVKLLNLKATVIADISLPFAFNDAG